MSKQYRDEQEKIKQLEIDKMLNSLPEYVSDFIGNLKRRNRKIQTLLIYTQRVFAFFMYLEKSPSSPFHNVEAKKITTMDLDTLGVEDIDRFLTNSNLKGATSNNYLSALNALFTFLYNRDKLSKNIITKVERASNKAYEHQVVRLTDAQAKGFIESAELGTGLSKKQLIQSKKNGTRDYVICLTLLRTGLRVSELVSLDIGNIDFDENCFNVIRKGNKPDSVYFDDEVREVLLEYIDTLPSSMKTDPLFISNWGNTKGKRITVRQVEYLVRKYSSAGALGTGLGISPHKLRATFATAMLKETGNITLVKEQLSHENIQTTSIYIDGSTQDKRNARNILLEKEKDREDEKGTIYKKGF